MSLNCSRCITSHPFTSFLKITMTIGGFCTISFNYKPDYAVKAGEPLDGDDGSTKV